MLLSSLIFIDSYVPSYHFATIFDCFLYDEDVLRFKTEWLHFLLLYIIIYHNWPLSIIYHMHHYYIIRHLLPSSFLSSFSLALELIILPDMPLYASFSWLIGDWGPSQLWSLSVCLALKIIALFYSFYLIQF